MFQDKFKYDAEFIEGFIDTFFDNLKPWLYYTYKYFTPYLIEKYEYRINFYSLSSNNVRIPNKFVLKHYKELNWSDMKWRFEDLYDNEFWEFCKKHKILPDV